MNVPQAQRQRSGPFITLRWRTPRSYTPPEPAVTDRYGDRPRVPRQWRPGLGSTSSLAGPAWPPDASSGLQMAVVQHARIIRPRNPNNAAVTSGSSPRPSTSARVIPVHVPIRGR